MVFYRSGGGELIPWCPEVVLYLIQPVHRQTLMNLQISLDEILEDRVNNLGRVQADTVPTDSR